MKNRKAKNLAPENLQLINWLKKVTMFIFIWELIGIFVITARTIFSKNVNSWNLNYGDFYRTDLGYLIATGSFSNPYEYHPELPNITVTNYLPLPFVFLKLFNIRLVDSWSKFSLPVQAFTYFSIFLLFIIIYFSMRNFDRNFRFLSAVTFGVISVPSLYIFSTSNTQALVTFFIFIGFIPILVITNEKNSRINSISKNRLFRFGSFILVGSFKPQYLSFVLTQYFGKLRQKLVEGIVYALATLLFVFLGFALFSGNFLEKIRFFLSSLSQFTSSNMAFVVHNNVSIIGNLSALEVFFNKDAINNSFILQYKSLILGLYIVTCLILFMILYFKNAPVWLNTWLLGELSIIATPVSFAYSFTALLVALGLFFNAVQRIDERTLKLFTNKANRILLIISLVSIFPPKFFHITLIEGVADTNLYALLTSVSHICIMLIGFSFVKMKAK